jgi:hypothetical protein
MWTRRQFLCRGVGSGLGLMGGALGWHALSQDNAPGAAARGMITPAAQRAIDQGLAYLERVQHADGSFGTGQHRGNVAITSLGGMAMLAGGHQPGRGRYGRVVRRAVEFILNQEQPQPAGYLFNRNSALHGPMYGHGFAALFLAEVQGMVHDRNLRERLRGTLSRAIRLIIDTQNGEGGWRYQPRRQDADISVTICQIMALRAARNAGITVPKNTVDNCTRYVQQCQVLIGGEETRGGFRYQRGIGPVGFARTAAGVVALNSAGIYNGENVQSGLDYLLRNCKPGSEQRGMPRHFGEFQIHYYYGHYYAVQAMWTAGGRYWTEWFPAIREALINHGDRQADGSWRDNRICTHYATAMALVILQIPNNYLPIFQR